MVVRHLGLGLIGVALASAALALPSGAAAQAQRAGPAAAQAPQDSSLFEVAATRARLVAAQQERPAAPGRAQRSDPTLAAPIVDCTTASGANPPNCPPLTLAAYDVQQWAAAVNAVLPNPVSTIICSNVVNLPVDCTIQISWGENAVAINRQGADAATLAGASFNVPTYLLNVEP